MFRFGQVTQMGMHECSPDFSPFSGFLGGGGEKWRGFIQNLKFNTLKGLPEQKKGNQLIVLLLNTHS